MNSGNEMGFDLLGLVVFLVVCYHIEVGQCP